MSVQEHELYEALGSSGARVAAIDAIPVALPLRRPVEFASGTITTADNVLVRVHSDTGIIGCAEAQPRPYTYGETQASIVAAINRFAPRLIGADPVRSARNRALISDGSSDTCARAAVLVALADLSARVLGVSCADLLGGAADDVAVAAMVSFGTPEQMGEDAAQLHADQGIEVFKVKVGRDPGLDIASVMAVREAVPGATLYVDANRGWNLEQAREAVPGLLELGVQMIEEPLDLADRDGRVQLAAEWPVPLGGDESCLDLGQVAEQIAGPVSQVSIKIARTAFDEGAAVAAYCRATGVHAVVGSQYEGALGAWASIAFAAGVRDLSSRPAEVANFLDLADDLVASPVITDGRVAVPDGPGLGATIDEAAVARYRVDR
jgi:L-alanine-DL-glutamate epimerase-like enolase superfamily enzyme